MEHEERLKAALADHYQIEREIGSGGMATVYLAQDRKVVSRKLCKRGELSEEAGRLGKKRGSSLELFIAT
jgi:serine/threonine-protein kinase